MGMGRGGKGGGWRNVASSLGFSRLGPGCPPGTQPCGQRRNRAGQVAKPARRLQQTSGGWKRGLEDLNTTFREKPAPRSPLQLFFPPLLHLYPVPWVSCKCPSPATQYSSRRVLKELRNRQTWGHAPGTTLKSPHNTGFGASAEFSHLKEN